jgi:hypothetical protein
MGNGSSVDQWVESIDHRLGAVGTGINSVWAIVDAARGDKSGAKERLADANNDLFDMILGQGNPLDIDTGGDSKLTALQKQAKAILQEQQFIGGNKNPLNAALGASGGGTTVSNNLTNQIRGVSGNPAMSGTRQSNLNAISDPVTKMAMSVTRGQGRSLLNNSMNLMDYNSLKKGQGIGFPDSGAVNNSGGTQGPSTQMDTKQPQGGLQVN